MKINKTTYGFVVQRFNTRTGKYIKQEFIAGDQVNYTDMDGVPANWKELEKVNFGPYAKNEPYLPFEMKQPEE